MADVCLHLCAMASLRHRGDFIRVKERIKKGAVLETPGGWKLGETPKPLDDDDRFDKIISVLESVLRTVLSPEQFRDVAAKAESKIKQEAFSTIDATPLLGPIVEPWTVPYDRFGSVSALLNDIWFTLRKRGHYLPNLSFGSAWVLEVDGRHLTEQDVGIRWERKHESKEFDDRPLDHPNVGIKPGMQLRVVHAET